MIGTPGAVRLVRPAATRYGRSELLQLREPPRHLDRALAGRLVAAVEGPRHPVARGAVQSRVAREQPEREPALEHGRVGIALEPADVVTPVPESAEREREAAAQALGHRRERRGVVAAPVHRHLLAAGRRRAREEHGLAGPAHVFEHLEHRAVVELGVPVVHRLGVAAVVPDDVDGDPLAEVGLDRVDALVEQAPQVRLEPRRGIGVREVDERHAGLPQVPLPDACRRHDARGSRPRRPRGTAATAGRCRGSARRSP